MNLPLTSDARVLKITPELVKNLWDMLQAVNHGSLWYELDGSSITRFYQVLLESALVIGWPFGLARFNNYIPGHSVRAHLVFWKRPDVKALQELADLIASRLYRMDVVVPVTKGPLVRLLSSCGFRFEGIMRNYFLVDKGPVDAALWARTGGYYERSK